MPNTKTSHTPGPQETVEGGKECGCLILTRKGDNNYFYIEYCSVHTAAPALLEAARTVLNVLQNLQTEEFRCGGDKPARDLLESVIKQATGDV